MRKSSAVRGLVRTFHREHRLLQRLPVDLLGPVRKRGCNRKVKGCGGAGLDGENYVG
jgi:hypothetical protein